MDTSAYLGRCIILGDGVIECRRCGHFGCHSTGVPIRGTLHQMICEHSELA